MIALGIVFGIMGALLLMIGDGNGWPFDRYGDLGHSVRLLFGLGGINIMLGAMMYIGSQEEVVSRRPIPAAF